MSSSSGILPSSADAGALAARVAQRSPERPHTPRLRASRAFEIARLLPLLVLLGVCLSLVALAAHGASFLSPTATSRSYPGWMAGPLSGLWPGGLPRTYTLEWLVSGALGVLFVAYALAVREAPRIHPGLVLGAIAAIQLIFLLAPPLQYTDVFNYVNYGRMGLVHHLNPYSTLPLAEPHSDPSYAISNWHYLQSPYGPLFTLLTYALVPLGIAASLWAVKILVGLCSLGLLVLVWRLARLLGRSPALAVALVGLNPIVLFWGLGGEHNDFIMMFLVFGSIYLLIAPRLRGEPSRTAPRPSEHLGFFGPEFAAGVLLVGGIGIKASGAIFLVLAIAIAERRRALLAGIAAAAVLLIAVSLLVFGPHIGGVRAQSTLVSPEGLPNLLGILLGLGGETSGLRAVLSAVALLVILLAGARALRHREDALLCGCISAIAAIFTLGWSAPWYVLWALPFAALLASRRWRWLLLAYTLYALIASCPNLPDIEHDLNVHPRSDRLGRQHILQFERLGAQ